jgi:methylated-DNA-protein-cysteine methyltransferase-like protein
MGRSASGRARFDAAVYALVRRIPPGRVVTYGQLAGLVGSPRAARAVGQAMRRCPAGVPWHRVVNAQGRVSRRRNPGSMLTQKLLLQREGVAFRRETIDLGRHRWTTGAGRRRFDPDALPAW